MLRVAHVVVFLALGISVTSAPISAPTGIIGSIDPPELIETRQHSFLSSMPHVQGANCHVSIVRPLDECAGRCSQHGLCSGGGSGDVGGDCWCWAGWTGVDCGLAVTLAIPPNSTSASASSASTPSAVSSAQSAFPHPKVEFCYYQLTYVSFFDYTSYDQPTLEMAVDLVRQTTFLPQQTLLQHTDKSNAAVDEEEEDLEGIPPPPPASVYLSAGTEAVSEAVAAALAEEESVDVPPAPLALPRSKGPLPLVVPVISVDTITAYGTDSTFHTAMCATWDRLKLGPSAQGYTVNPPVGVFPGFETSIEVTGFLYAFNKFDKTRHFQGNAHLKWLLLHSQDGTNVNYRVLAQGETQMIDSHFQTMGMFEGIPVYGHVPNFAGGYLALWMDLQFESRLPVGPLLDVAVVCDDLQWVVRQGKRLEYSGSGSGDAEAECPDCNVDPVNNPVIQLPMPQISG